ALTVFGSLALAPAVGPVNWYAPQQVDGWLRLVSADAYRGLLDLPGAPLRLAAALRTLVANLGAVGAVITAAGLQEVLARRRARGVGGTLTCAALALAYLVFTALYAARDADAYLLPALVLLTPAAAIGIRAAAGTLQDVAARIGAPPSAAAALLTVLVLGQPAVQVVRLMPALDLRTDRTAAEYAARALDDAPPRAVLVAHGDAATFALWYTRYALGRRADVAVLNDDLLAHSWYRAHVTRLHPDVVLPPLGAGDGVDAETAVALLKGANQGRVVRAPVAPTMAEPGPRP
ncbi:MAG TPA: hypothetical protein VFX49_04760, partial [Chloroflexota bacterium]|nr:hypothetical protein [Chloroflexota bacterium]